MSKCVFCEMVLGREECHIIWEDNHNLAFLSKYPNTLGVSVVITKMHYESYAFSNSDEVLTQLIIAAKTVARILDTKFDTVERTALILEGYGVNHLHAKLYPLHGTKNQEKWQPIKSNVQKYFDRYEGYVSSHDHQLADSNELKKLAEYLKN